MRAVLCESSDDLGGVVLTEVPDPVAGPGQVVVDIEAASVEFVDTLIMTGRYQIKIPPPFIPGNNLAGTVRSVGEGVETLAVGDRVHGMAFMGAFAERVSVAASQMRRTPDGLGADAACLTGSTYRTAYDSVVTTGSVSAGDDVVILGAAGAVGSAAITIAKALGAQVIACASSQEKLEFCESLGADETVRYGDDDFKSQLKALCPNGVDVVLDMVGGPYSEPALRAVGYGGRFIVVGFAAGNIPRVPLNLVLLKGSTITGYEIASFERNHPDIAEQNRAQMESMLASGALIPPISARYRLDDALEAIRVVAGRDKLGMTILEMT